MVISVDRVEYSSLALDNASHEKIKHMAARVPFLRLLFKLSNVRGLTSDHTADG